jgi:hypothetical protein
MHADKRRWGGKDYARRIARFPSAFIGVYRRPIPPAPYAFAGSEALRHHDVSLKYAPTAQAKGKIERQLEFSA